MPGPASGDPLRSASGGILGGKSAGLGGEDHCHANGVSVLPAPIAAAAIRGWQSDVPENVAPQRRPPCESRDDSVMYCRVLAGVAAERGWDVCTYDAKSVEAKAAAMLGPRADEVLHGRRITLGPPWSKDHRTALVAVGDL